MMMTLSPSTDPCRKGVDFWDKVGAGDGCWEWKCGRVGGYGQTSADGQQVYAHRRAWELVHGPIPPGRFVLHHCDNPACCRPSHLFLGTRADNNRDRNRKGRQARGETNGRAKLTQAQAEEIRRRYAAGGTSHRKLAQEYGVSYVAVRKIVNCQRYLNPGP